MKKTLENKIQKYKKITYPIENHVHKKYQPNKVNTLHVQKEMSNHKTATEPKDGSACGLNPSAGGIDFVAAPVLKTGAALRLLNGTEEEGASPKKNQTQSFQTKKLYWICHLLILAQII